MGKLNNYEFLKNNNYNLQYPHEKFLELYNQGLNDAEISRILGCSHATITQKRNKFNLKSNFKYTSKIDKNKLIELYKEGKNDRQIGEYFGVNNRWVGEVRRGQLNLDTRFGNNIKSTPGSLTEEEEQVLVGSVLGDAHLKKDNVIGGTGGSFMHGLKQREYAYWKYTILKRFCLKPPQEKQQFHKIRQKMYFSVATYFRVDTIFNKYYDLFYKNKIKIISEGILHILKPLGLAVWFMDDGMKGTHGGYYLCTNCFTENEVNLIINHFKDKWNLDCSIHRNVDRIRLLYIKKKSAQIFKDLIEKHIHEELKYKLH